jgi:hypothetical protein
MILRQYLRYGRKKLYKVKIYKDDGVHPIATKFQMSKGNIAGVMIAFEIPIYDNNGPGIVGIGFAKWNRKRDEYDHDFMIKLARERAILWTIKEKMYYNIPPSVKWDLYWFIKRCKNYYKDKELPKWTKNLIIMIDSNIDYYNYIPSNLEGII